MENSQVQDLLETRSDHVIFLAASDEKQISVDPISLRDSSTKKVSTQLSTNSNPKSLSYSLPNSASSSPKFRKNILTHASSLPAHVHPLYHHQQSIALTNLERLRHIHLSRSKSCGEGRASVPSEDLEFWSRSKNYCNIISTSGGENKIELEEEEDSHRVDIHCEDEDFKCGALCLFLPGFGKPKPEKTKMYEPAAAGPEMVIDFLKESEESGHVVSKRISLEKFECGSWRSSAIMDDEKEEGGGIKDIASNLFYDLPLEMIRFSSINHDDTHSPVTSAFVFEKDAKGVLKKSSSTATVLKTSHTVSRCVRYSTSSSQSSPASPTNSVTRMEIQMAKEELKALLEAQI